MASEDRDETISYLLQCVDDIRHTEEPPNNACLMTEPPATVITNNKSTGDGHPLTHLDRLTAYQRKHVLGTLLSKLHRFGNLTFVSNFYRPISILYIYIKHLTHSCITCFAAFYLYIVIKE